MNNIIRAAHDVLESFDKRDIDDGHEVIRMFELAPRMEALRQALVDAEGMCIVPIHDLAKVKDALEYWINKNATRDMTNDEYNFWLSLGHHSSAMQILRKSMREASNG